jgi:predicted dehydrogenase
MGGKIGHRIMKSQMACLAWVLTFHLIAESSAFAAAAAAPVKVGIIGLDAHAVPWTQLIHGARAPLPISDLRVVAAVPTFSADIPFSRDNIEQNTTKMRDLGVEICDTIEAMLAKVDAVMLLSIDGRPHPQQARLVFTARKPLFIDKPVAASLVEVIGIFRDRQGERHAVLLQLLPSLQPGDQRHDP